MTHITSHITKTVVTLTIMLCVILCACSSVPVFEHNVSRETSARHDPRTVVVLGDSTASLSDGKPAGDKNHVTECRQEAKTWPTYIHADHVINLACPGYNTHDIVTTIHDITQFHPTDVLLSIGSNDARRGQSVEEITDTLVDIIHTIRHDTSARIVLVDYLPIIVEGTCIPDTRKVEGYNTSIYHRVASIAMHKAAEKTHTDIIDMSDLTVHVCGDNADYIHTTQHPVHPVALWHTSAKGHRRIASTINDFLHY